MSVGVKSQTNKVSVNTNPKSVAQTSQVATSQINSGVGCNANPIVINANNCNIFVTNESIGVSGHGLNARLIDIYTHMLYTCMQCSQNNCDLITEDEWIHVIEKHMTAKGYSSSEHNWKLLYRTFTEHYIKALDKSVTVSELQNRFPFTDFFNLLLVNPINGLYDQVMKSRDQFVSKLLANKDCGKQYEIMERTIQQQRYEEWLRNRRNGFQTRLESNIVDIKRLNLMVKVISELKLASKNQESSNLFVKISNKLLENGINWEPHECRRTLCHWIEFYERNYDNYKLSVKEGNRIVEYIYQYLNSIDKYTSDLKLLFAKGYTSSGNKWMILYQVFIEHYLKALNKSVSLNELQNEFPFAHIFNQLIFNPINSHYNLLMQSRQQFMSKILKNKEFGPHYETMERTIEQQTHQNWLRCRRNGFQKRLETNIIDIKRLNLMVQVISELKRIPKHEESSHLFEKISNKLHKNGINCVAYECQRSLCHWIEFYERNYENYKLSVKEGNKIVEYIYQSLNSIAMYSSDLKLLFSKNKPILHSLRKIEKCFNDK
ncbi:unnamed protein product [Oppiella nova]|uniref:Uncharacterized protein n=1 Tax=Oppiella nova TaxID=334625 RepID=A0A7R9LLW1_9ACAR|nr:unnamed protein product [Oppiella nova]CAG2164282.1 unnamed protein product [Oppiella nova]